MKYTISLLLIISIITSCQELGNNKSKEFKIISVGEITPQIEPIVTQNIVDTLNSLN